jgi:PAS domain S-box-containing protein
LSVRELFPLKPWQADLFAVLATVATLGLRVGLDGPYAAQPALVITFIVPIVLGGYLGGLRSGLLATALSYLLASYYLLPPIHSFGVSSTLDRWSQVSLLLAGLVISVLNEGLHRARRRADDATVAHQQAEHALRKAAALQSATFKGASASSIVTDGNGVIQFLGAAVERMLGYTASDVANGLTVDEIADQQALVAHAKALSLESEISIAPGFEAMVFKAARGVEDSYELSYARKDGSRLSALVSAYPLRDSEEAIIGYLLMLADNTAREQADNSRRQTEALLGTIYSHFVVSISDDSGHIVDVNDNLCLLSGYSRDELRGQTDRVVNAGAQDRAFWTHLGRTLSAGKAWRGEICGRTKDGSPYWLDSIIAPFSSQHGRMVDCISIGTDITAAKLTEQRLRSSEAFLDRVEKMANVGGWELELRTQSLTWSAQMYRLHEVDPGSYSPLHAEMAAFYPPDARALLERAMSHGLEHHTGWDLELPFVTAKGSSMWVRAVGMGEFENGKAVRLIGTLQDISERKQAEQMRRESEARYRTLFEYAPYGILIADRQGNYLDANASMCRMLGYAREELIGLNAADIVALPETEYIGPALTAINAQSNYQREWRFRRKDGSVVAAEVIATKMPDGNLLAMIHDITERKRTEARFRRLVDSNAQGVMFWNAKGEIASANEAFLRTVGYSIEDLAAGSMSWVTMTPPKYAELDRRALQELAASGVCTPYEKEFLRKDGSCVSVMLGAATFEDNADEGVCFVIDITARKQVENEQKKLDQDLRDQQFYTRSLIESNIDALMTTDPLGIVTDVNNQMEALTGRTREELIGAPFKNYFTDPERAAAGIQLVLSREKITDYELTARARDGKETVVSYNATTFSDRESRLRGVFASLRDITELKQHEESMRAAIHKAEQASRAKSEFLANMSHEIRTPMNAVIGLSYLLGQTSLSEQQQAFLTKVKLASKSLLLVINNVLDLSKIEAGELIVESAPFSLRVLLKELTDMMAVQAEAKGISFEVDAPDDLPRALEGDATRLHQVLTNLLSNAIKFTERGGVKLRVRRLAVTPEHATLCFTVQDTGIGIEPEVQAGLFAPFAQADASITRRFGGTGLGLSIVKRLVKLMGGEVALDSTPGVGSEFRVVLHVALASPEALAGLEDTPAAPLGRALLGVRILVVDDSDINRDVTKHILELEGARVWLASNGQEAFERLKAEPRAVDLVLMDVQMPLLDGHETTQRIRRELNLADLPIIALTAGALSSERERAVAAGMDDYIVKPFDAQALVRSILRHVKPASGRLAPQNGETAETRTPSRAPWIEIDGIDSTDVRVRLSDDDRLFRSMLKRLLDEFSALAIPAHAGDVALAVHARHMHKLRGSAGMLGAGEIQRIAGEAETACLAGEAGLASDLTTTLATMLHQLHESAAPAWTAAQAEFDELALAGGGELEPQRLRDLVDLLRQQDLSALDRFNAISPQLRRLLGKSSYELVRGRLDNLHFHDAADLLEASQLEASPL